MPEKPPTISRLTVEENGQRMDVFIPQTGDRSEDEYMLQAEAEKTRDELRHKSPKGRPKRSPEDVAGALKEAKEYAAYRKEGWRRKYY